MTDYWQTFSCDVMSLFEAMSHKMPSSIQFRYYIFTPFKNNIFLNRLQYVLHFRTFFLCFFLCKKALVKNKKIKKEIHFNCISRTHPRTQRTCLRSSMKYTTHADESYITTDFITITHAYIHEQISSNKALASTLLQHLYLSNMGIHSQTTTASTLLKY